MKTIWEPACRQEILDRFEKFTSDRRPACGSMTAAQTLAHLTDPMKTALGEIKAAAQPGPFRNPIFRTLIIYCLPWPKGAPTAPEFVHAHEEHFADNLTALRSTLDKFVKAGEGAHHEPHPSFGRLSGRAWGRLTYRHLDHHLRQFGM